MKIWSAALFIFAIFSLSCSTTHKETHLEDWSQKQTAEQKEWLAKYHSAKLASLTNPAQACADFTELAGHSKFLLVDLALERAHLNCEHPETLPPISKEWLESKPWLQSLDVERNLHEAELSKDPKQLTNALIERSKQSVLSREKTDLLTRAMEQAKLSQDPELIKDASERFYRVAPRMNPNPSKKDWPRVAQDLLLQRNFTEARDYLTKIVGDKDFSSDEKYQALKQIRNSYKVEQKKSDYIKASNNLVSWLKKNHDRRLIESYVMLARAHWTEGDISAAKQTLHLAEKELRGKFSTEGSMASMEDIDFILGKMDEEAHDYKAALKQYRLAEADAKEAKNPTHASSHANLEKILFSQAWVLRKMEEFEKSAVKFTELEVLSEDPYAKFKYRFWEANSWAQAGQPDVSHRLFKSLTQDDPLGYYGMVSYFKLNEPMPALKENLKTNLEPSSSISLDLNLQRMMRALVEVDEKDVLSKLISSQLPQFRAPASLNQEDMLFVFKNLAESGLYQPLFSQLSLLDPETKNKLLEEHPELLFPRRYLELIAPASTKFGVEPELVLSIIRQESSFDPMARSAADAFGLMQLLPTVAQLEEKNANVHLEHHEDLYLPEINIPVGVALLSHLQQKYHGQLILTAAAYNASEKAIATWLKMRLRQDPLEFIEDIPYEETRAYVKLVMRNYIFYHRMSKVGESLPFPTHCLEDLQSNRDSIVSQ